MVAELWKFTSYLLYIGNVCSQILGLAIPWFEPGFFFFLPVEPHSARNPPNGMVRDIRYFCKTRLNLG